MAKKNSIIVAFEGMTALKSERVTLELLNRVDRRDGFTIEPDKFFYVARPIEASAIEYVAISENATYDDVTIAYNGGCLVFGKAYHMERCTEKYNAFTVVEIELPKPW